MKSSEAVNLWGKYYQTENDLLKKADFLKDAVAFGGKGPNESEIKRLSTLASTAFAADIRMSEEDMSDLLRYTAYHESDGGKYDEQYRGGPARGWWMVEPETARDLMDDSDKALLFGPKAEKLLEEETGLTLDDLREMSEEELSEALKKPAVSALFAGAKYATALYKERR